MRNKLRAAALLLAVAVAGSGLALAQDGYHYYDRDKGYDNHYGYNDSGLRIARSTGYDDGSRMAYHDLTHYKPFHPYPRGKYSHEDHGYHREYGDKYDYRAEYERGYRAGYAATFRR
jgi:hypothetical protein